MEQSPLIDKVSQELMLQIIETTNVSYFIESHKTCSVSKLNSILPKYTVDQITSIPISGNDFHDNFLEMHIQWKDFSKNNHLGHQ